MKNTNPPAVQIHHKQLEEYVQEVCKRDGLEYDIFYAYDLETFSRPHLELERKGIQLEHPYHMLRYAYSTLPSECRWRFGGRNTGEIVFSADTDSRIGTSLEYNYTTLIKDLERGNFLVKLLYGREYKGMNLTSKVESDITEESSWLFRLTEYHNRIVLLNRAFRQASQLFEQSMKLGKRED